jgi:hypothetical protein
MRAHAHHPLPVAFVTLLVLSSQPACGPESSWQDSTAVQARAPLTGKADSGDKADRTCQVVLRNVSREFGNNSYITRCTGGVCNWVWQGSVEVAEGVQGAKVRLLYRLASGGTWWQVDASPVTHGSPGYVRHSFSIHEHLVGPSASAAQLAATRVELMPFIELPDGTRHFDHNRVSGALDNYALEQQKGFGLGDGGACAPVFGKVSFFKGWGEHLSGTLRQGGHLVVDYDIDRLTQCRGTHNGHPAWDVIGHVKFAPGGQLVTGSVRTLKSNQGTPTNEAERKELRVKIPAGATSVALWFKNYTGAGSSCVAWDSNLGSNYTYSIMPPADDPRCEAIERWTKVNSDVPYKAKPACLAQAVDQHHDADNCELYLEGIGQGYVGHHAPPTNWLEAYLAVGLQQGTLLEVGMLVQYRDKATGQLGRRISLGRDVAPGIWQAGFITHRPSMMGITGYSHEVQQLAFFIDVRRPTGTVVRLWQSRHGANFSLGDAFSLATTTKYIAYGSIKYASPGAAIFGARRACAP